MPSNLTAFDVHEVFDGNHKRHTVKRQEKNVPFLHDIPTSLTTTSLPLGSLPTEPTIIYRLPRTLKYFPTVHAPESPPLAERRAGRFLFKNQPTNINKAQEINTLHGLRIHKINRKLRSVSRSLAQGVCLSVHLSPFQCSGARWTLSTCLPVSCLPYTVPTQDS